MKAATQKVEIVRHLSVISIHAAREGGDKKPLVEDGKWGKFQSTPPVKAATMLDEAVGAFN